MKPDQLFRFGQPRPDELLKNLASLEAAMSPEAAIAGLEAIEAAELEFARSQYKTPVPPPGVHPYHMSLGDLLGEEQIKSIEAHGKFVFHAVGDVGQHGHGAAAQESVAYHMERQVEAPGDPLDNPGLFYVLGDVVYYSGELDQYPEQFYDPYTYYRRPIVAIPGNHDGDNVSGEESLGSFVRNFCTKEPERPQRPGLSQRLTMTQPNYYFTLDLPFVTLIGLYSNTTGDLDDPNGGSTEQYEWLVEELAAAPVDKFIIVAVHHPPFSADTSHGPGKRIDRDLDKAFREAGVLPHMVLAGHVHNYQRFSRNQSLGSGQPVREIPYIVAGAGGYAGFDDLHQVNEEAPMPSGVRLEKSNEESPTFLTLTATATTLKCDCYTVPRPPNHTRANHSAELFDGVEVVLSE